MTPWIAYISEDHTSTPSAVSQCQVPSPADSCAALSSSTCSHSLSSARGSAAGACTTAPISRGESLRCVIENSATTSEPSPRATAALRPPAEHRVRSGSEQSHEPRGVGLAVVLREEE